MLSTRPDDRSKTTPPLQKLLKIDLSIGFTSSESAFQRYLKHSELFMWQRKFEFHFRLYEEINRALLPNECAHLLKMVLSHVRTKIFFRTKGFYITATVFRNSLVWAATFTQHVFISWGVSFIGIEWNISWTVTRKLKFTLGPVPWIMLGLYPSAVFGGSLFAWESFLYHNYNITDSSPVYNSDRPGITSGKEASGVRLSLTGRQSKKRATSPKFSFSFAYRLSWLLCTCHVGLSLTIYVCFGVSERLHSVMVHSISK